MKHTHADPEVLTAACPACVKRVEQDQEAALVAESPLRRVTWHFVYHLHGDAECSDMRTLSAQTVIRVPPGWDAFKLDAWYADVVGNAFLMALPDGVPMSETDQACESMSVTGATIGEVVVPDVEEQPDDPHPSLV